MTQADVDSYMGHLKHRKDTSETEKMQMKRQTKIVRLRHQLRKLISERKIYETRAFEDEDAYEKMEDADQAISEITQELSKLEKAARMEPLAVAPHLRFDKSKQKRKSDDEDEPLDLSPSKISRGEKWEFNQGKTSDQSQDEWKQELDEMAERITNVEKYKIPKKVKNILSSDEEEELFPTFKKDKKVGVALDGEGKSIQQEEKIKLVQGDAEGKMEIDSGEEMEEGRKKALFHDAAASEDRQIIDLSPSIRSKEDRSPLTFYVGGGYTILLGIIQFTYNQNSAEYEGITIEKVTTDQGDPSKSKSFNFNMPSKYLTNAVKAISLFRKEMEANCQLPELDELVAATERMSFDLTEYGENSAPQVTYKLDPSGQYLFSGSTITYSKGSFDVFQFKKEPMKGKDGKKGKPFVMSIPMRFFDKFELAFKYFHEKFKPVETIDEWA